eukprot:scaffold136981_cov139-Phaeocystis_antarctica.AAC.1
MIWTKRSSSGSSPMCDPSARVRKSWIPQGTTSRPVRMRTGPLLPHVSRSARIPLAQARTCLSRGEGSGRDFKPPILAL